jgi:hypothetical protein
LLAPYEVGEAFGAKLALHYAAWLSQAISSVSPGVAQTGNWRSRLAGLFR